MPNLKQLRNNIKSVKSTKKITKTMQLVSSVKLKKLKAQIKNCSNYLENVNNIMLDIFPLLSNTKLSTKEKRFFFQNNKAKNIIILISSDKGLCGSFNHSIINAVKDDIEYLRSKENPIELFIIGEKGYNFLKYDYLALIKQYYCNIKNNNEYVINQIKDELIRIVENFGINSCYIYYHKFKNNFIQNMIKEKILPINKTINSDVIVDLKNEYEGQGLIMTAVSLYIHAKLYSTLIENKTSEEGRRVITMDKATQNAKDIIDKLTIELNRSRQEIITKELIEIITGSKQFN